MGGPVARLLRVKAIAVGEFDAGVNVAKLGAERGGPGHGGVYMQPDAMLSRPLAAGGERAWRRGGPVSRRPVGAVADEGQPVGDALGPDAPERAERGLVHPLAPHPVDLDDLANTTHDPLLAQVRSRLDARGLQGVGYVSNPEFLAEANQLGFSAVIRSNAANACG